MNKSHFEESRKAMQEDHAAELASLAERHASDAASDRKASVAELEALKAAVAKAHAELEDERVAKKSALAKLAIAEQSQGGPEPPMSPRSISKLHEAHNAKVAELERVIQELSSGLQLGKEGPNGGAAKAEVDEEETF